jgi:EAL domain-containing protein (putative c-di-GMP-specific phosphodiesterase class I)
MSVNISPKQLREEAFLNTIKSLDNYKNLKAAWLDAEITENILLEGDSKANAVFETLKEMKVSLSVDDFGSGYSSFGYLNKFRFDRIKIDQSLIGQLSLENANGIQVVKAIISMADAMGLCVIAEGVETEEQLEILKKLKCHQGQGFYLGRPVSAADFEGFLFRPD